MGDSKQKNVGTDKELGMGRGISRRDFLNGVAWTAASSMLPPHLVSALEGGDLNPEQSPIYYPPALTGLRGSHVGSFEVAHSVRDDDFWPNAGQPIETGEKLDLVIVGGGISGLSAAYFFRKANPGARILILENHDDFGGHAKRNEFTVGDRRLLGFGGTFAIESPAPYSRVAKSLISELGIDVSTYSQHVATDLYRSQGLLPGIFFDQETFGRDVLTVNPLPVGGTDNEGNKEVNTEEAWKRFLAEAPLTVTAKRDIETLRQGVDYFPGLTSGEKKARMARMSYARYLTELAKVDPQIVKIYQAAPHGNFGVGIDAVSAQDAWGSGYLGFRGLKLDATPGKGMNRDTIPNAEAEKYFFHFPDGNATIARLLVRDLIPEAMPGRSADDVVTARANYAKLDREASPVRLRLNSTVVRVRHVGSPASAREVEITYSRFGKLYSARAPFAVLACWNMVIPYICSELPEEQKKALHFEVKVPLLYTNVTIRNWMALQKVRANEIYAPGCYHTTMWADLPVSIGDYHYPTSPQEPVVVHMEKTPCRPGMPARDQHRLGRVELFTTDFETIERKIRDQLARVLGGGGFDPARDIAAITVNRWPHGYAYEYNSLWDRFWLEGGVTPCEIARKPFGRITIANADAGAYAYTDGAIDQAWRAVEEIQQPSKLGI
jgi:spermidine dehydrogenase